MWIYISYPVIITVNSIDTFYLETDELYSIPYQIAWQHVIGG